MASEEETEGVKEPSVARRVLSAGMKRANRQLDYAMGGPLRVKVIVVLACVLALSSADSATVGASAIALRHSLKIDNTDIGLLVAVSSAVAAVFSLPFGMLADRVHRTGMLAMAIVTWGAAMIWSATSTSFERLLIARTALGAVTAVAGPVIASLVGDWFDGNERGQIYSYILTGELVGAGIGFVVTGDISAFSWRAAFIILALPAFVLAWFVWRLPEPQRGVTGVLSPTAGTRPALRAKQEAKKVETGPPGKTDAQQLALDRGIAPDERLVEMADPKMGVFSATRYVLAVRTNVALVASGALAYFFLAGVETFAPEFVSLQYHTSQVAANLLLLVLGVGAVGGILIGGPLGDALLHRGRINGRIVVAAVAAVLATVLFLPPLLTTSALTALPYLVIGAGALTAQNPPTDAARLDIMPSWLWGRAEGIRTFLRSGAQSLAPLLFGSVADHIFGGHRAGLQLTFITMLVPMGASAVILFWALKHYPTDVATAALVTGGGPAPVTAVGPESAAGQETAVGQETASGPGPSSGPGAGLPPPELGPAAPAAPGTTGRPDPEPETTRQTSR